MSAEAISCGLDSVPTQPDPHGAPTESSMVGTEMTTHKRASRRLTRHEVENINNGLTVSGSFIEYVGLLLVVAVGACVVACLPLFLPLNDPTEGFAANTVYFYIYNPYVCLIYVLGSYQRLCSICSRTGSADPEDDFKVTLWNLRGVGVITLATMQGSAIMALVGYLADTKVGTSYMMMYCAPITSTISDVLFILLLPPKERRSEVADFLSQYSGLTGMPIFAVFAPLAVKKYLPGLSGVFIPIVVFPFMAAGLQYGVRHIITDKMAKLGYTCSWTETGIAVHLESLIAIAQMMMFPGATGILTLTLLVAVEGMTRIHEDHSLQKALSQQAQGTYALLPQPSPSTTTTTLRFPWLGQTEEEKASVKVTTNEMEEDAYYQVYMTGVLHLVAFTAPLIFSVLCIVIVNYVNKPYYYLYETFNSGEEFAAVQSALIAFGFQIVFLAMDMAFLFHMGVAQTFLLMFHSVLHMDKARIVCTLAFNCCVYTSCFFVKHDGIAILSTMQ